MYRAIFPTAKTINGHKRAAALLICAGLLAGCDESGQFNFALPGGAASQTSESATRSNTLIERDVEAPDVFSVTDQGLWDGRPSLGGVWVAHPDVTDPERVIIRNEANGKFVIGALFRKERDLPGPKLQISSDAAAALSILAGAPAPLNVTALRREEITVKEPAVESTDAIAAPAEVAEATLDPIAAAGAAIEAAPTPPPTPATPRPTSTLAKPFVQLGIFSIEGNADRVAKQMRSAGMLPTIKKSEINGKPFWRVVVGPAGNQAELNTLLKNIKSEGVSDAYAVSD
jgi:cell division septation protein DedD